jgi:hypothetical protein
VKYDLLLKGCHVIDPANGLDSKMDVGIRDGKIAAVVRDLPASEAVTAVDASGRLVTPGLIDLHTHSYGYFAWTFPDEYAFPAGVTTVVDAGGSGYRNFDDFKRTIIDKANVRLLALLNIVGGGMLGPVEQDTAEMRPEPCAEVVRANPDVIVGVKAAHYRGRGLGVGGRRGGGGGVVGHRGHDRLLESPGSYLPRTDNRAHGAWRHAHPHVRPAARADRRKAEGVRLRVGGQETRRALRCGPRRRQLLVPGGGAHMEQGHVPDTISTDVHKSSFFIPRATSTGQS